MVATSVQAQIMDTCSTSSKRYNKGRTFHFKLSAKPKTHHPDEEPKPRLPDSIAQPITNMPLSRMENTTFAMSSIIDSHDMGLRTVFTVQTPKRKRLFNER
ncbi:hypothetical protein TNCV_1571181 [Trichonephila clavipes]|uniref:Uncharacterized protein n=1 Tax=Trichonephila clavipes TaxID=2585209 RepID=A0A8X6VEC2_TRICX|nr:hypothetical protein TNCV_1571181 [Trichonephila clavipes]